MTDIFSLGIKADTTDLVKANKNLDKLGKEAVQADKKVTKAGDAVFLFASGAKKAGKGAEEFAKGAKKGGDSAEKAGKKAKKAGRNFKDMGVAAKNASLAIGAIGVVGAVALGVIISKSIEGARELRNLSLVAGEGIEDMQRLAFAAAEFGVGIGGLSVTLKKVQEGIGEFAATGVGTFKEFFDTVGKQAGLTIADFAGLTGIEQLQKVFNALEEGGASAGVVRSILGNIARDAVKLAPLLAENGKLFRELGERANELGIITSAFDISQIVKMGKTLGDAKSVIGDFGNVIAAELTPFIVELTDRFIDFLPSGKALGDFVGVAAERFAVFGAVIADVAVFLFDIGVLIVNIVGFLFEVGNAAVGAILSFLGFKDIDIFDTILEGVATVRRAFLNLPKSIGIVFETVLKLGAELGTALGKTFTSIGLSADILVLQVGKGLTAAVSAVLGGIESILNKVIEGFEKTINFFTAISDKVFKTSFGGIELGRVTLPALETEDFDEGIAEAREKIVELGEPFGKFGEIAAEGMAAIVEQLGGETFTDAADDFLGTVKEMTDKERELFAENLKLKEGLQKEQDAREIREAQDQARELARIEEEKNRKKLTNIQSTEAAILGMLRDSFNQAGEGIKALSVLFGESAASRRALHVADIALNKLEAVSRLSALFTAKKTAKTLEKIAKDTLVGKAKGLAGEKTAANITAKIGEALFGSKVKELAIGAEVTTATVANEGKKADSSAISAIASAFNLPPPFGFIAGAAMIAIMAGLGLATGGGGGGGSSSNKRNDGTGTVRGSDERSRSAAASQEMFETINLAQLVELRGIRLAVTSLNLAIENLSVDFRGGVKGLLAGGDTGLGGLVKKASKKRIVFIRQTLGSILDSLDQALSPILKSVGDIFQLISESVLVAADSLGFDSDVLGEAIKSFTVDIGRVRIKGLSSDEIREKLEAVFSQQADLIAEFLIPGISEFQKVGEGAFETLIRVSKEQAIFNDAMEQMGRSLSGLSTIMQIEIAQSIITLVGSAEKFADLTQEFFSEFFTEAEQFAQLTKSLTEAVEGLGLTMFETRGGFRAMVEGIDLTTEAGQMLFAALLELVPHMDEFFDTLEDNAAEEAAAEQRELAEATREAADAEKALQRARDLAEQRELAEATRAATEAEKALQKAREQTTRLLEKGVKDAFGKLSDAIEAEKDAAEEAFEAEKDAAEEAFAARAEAIGAEQDALKERLKADLSDIQTIFDEQRQVIQDKAKGQLESLGRQLDLVNEGVASLVNLSGLLGAAIDQIAGLGRAQARALIQEATEAAKAGQKLSTFDLAGAISALTNIQPEGFGSRLDLQLETAKTARELEELKGLADGQLSEAEQNVLLLERQIETIELAADRQIEALNLIQEEEEAATQLRFEEEEAATQLRFEEETAKLDEQLEMAQQQFDEEIARLDEVLFFAQEQLNALLGIDDRVLSLTDAVLEFNAAVAAVLIDADRNRRMEEGPFEDAATPPPMTTPEPEPEPEPSMGDMMEDAMGAPPSMDMPEPPPPEDIPQAPPPPPPPTTDPIDEDRFGRTRGFSERDILQSMAISTRKTAKLLEEWNVRGQPEVRAVA